MVDCNMSVTDHKGAILNSITHRQASAVETDLATLSHNHHNLPKLTSVRHQLFDESRESRKHNRKCERKTHE